MIDEIHIRNDNREKTNKDDINMRNIEWRCATHLSIVLENVNANESLTIIGGNARHYRLKFSRRAIASIRRDREWEQ